MYAVRQVCKPNDINRLVVSLLSVLIFVSTILFVQLIFVLISGENHSLTSSPRRSLILQDMNKTIDLQ